MVWRLQRQIPSGNDNQKERATASAEADSLVSSGMTNKESSENK
jgi:hypothetical protein